MANRPAFNIIATDTENRELKYSLGAAWPTQFDGTYSITFELETDSESKFKRLSLVDYAKKTMERQKKDGKRAFFVDLRPPRGAKVEVEDDLDFL